MVLRAAPRAKSIRTRAELLRSGRRAYAALRDRGLEIVRDSGAIEQAIAAAMVAKPDAVVDFRSGKQNAIGPLIGMIMKQVGGADPKQVRELLIAAIGR